MNLMTWTTRKLLLMGLLLLMALVIVAMPAGRLLASSSGAPLADYTCPGSSANSYSSGGMYQFDNDNPVRPAINHADKNLALRSYDLINNAALKTWANYGGVSP